MSGSDTGVMTSRDGFSMGHQNSAVPSVQSMRLSFSADGSAVYKPVAGSSPTYHPSGPGGAGTGDSSGGGGGNVGPHGLNMNMGGESMKRKRGRPRKYGPDGSMSLGLTPVSQTRGNFSSPIPSTRPTSGGSSSPTSLKKSRGRPPGSGKKHLVEALGSVGVGFAPHVITVKAGEDVSSKIMSFSQHGPRAVCILSANGAISNVTLRQPATSGGTVTYEGRFEILSLSGSFMLNESGGQRSRTGGLSVSLSGPDGRVLGGGVAGILTAASPVQVIVGSFVADGHKEAKQMEVQTTAPSMVGQGGGVTGVSSPNSRSESSGGAGSPLNQSTGGCNNMHPQGMSNMHWK